MRSFTNLRLACAVALVSLAHGVTTQSTVASSSSFDYVIVGGGTSGLVLAERLTENRNTTVLVLEAGGLPSENPLTSVPAGFLLLADTAVWWNYTTVPQSQLLNRTVVYPGGHVLGGGSTVNYLQYIRGGAPYYDALGQKIGDPTNWNSSNMFKYLKKGTAWTPPKNSTVGIQYGVDPTAYTPAGSPLPISYPAFEESFGAYWERALRNTSGLNLPLREANGGTNIGTFTNPFTVDPKNVSRSNSATSYLAVASSRPNLKVIQHAFVQKLDLQNVTSQGITAVGVFYTTSAGQFHVSARKEVIVSAGGIRSPQLLMVSGIGPRSELTRHNIPVIVENPGVGQNMTDHPRWGPTYAVTDNIDTTRFWGNATFFQQLLDLYEKKRQGQLAGTLAGVTGYHRLPDSFLRSIGAGDVANLPANWAHIQQLFLVAGLTFDPSVNAVSPGAVLLNPYSRGTITLQDSNMSTPPLIDPKWLSDSRDIQMAVEGFKVTRQIMGSASLKPIVVSEVAPGLNVTSDADIANFIRSNVIPMAHVSGTCGMKPRSNGGVVDSKFKVYGVSKLRVVDASVLSLIAPAPLQATIYGIAEKAADIIKGGN